MKGTGWMGTGRDGMGWESNNREEKEGKVNERGQ